MRDAVAEQYRAETGDTWRPRHGSHASQTGKLTSASIDARDFMRARKDRETRAHLPEGTLVAIAGGKDVADPAAVIARLDQAKAKCANIVLAHGGGPGVERIAARWAERNGIDQVVCKPDWNAHGRAAPFRRNEELLNLLPKGVIAFPGSGITDNLVTAPGSSASRSTSAAHSRSASRAASSLRRWRGPFPRAHIGVAATPILARASRGARAPARCRSPIASAEPAPVDDPELATALRVALARAGCVPLVRSSPVTASPSIGSHTAAGAASAVLPTTPCSIRSTFRRSIAAAAPTGALAVDDSPMKIAARFWPFGPRSGCLVTPDSPLVNGAHSYPEGGLPVPHGAKRGIPDDGNP